jgi:hypothetical protein
MKTQELYDYKNIEGKLLPDYSVEDSYTTPYPFNDNDTKEIKFSIAHVMKLTHKIDKKNHTTVLAYDGEEYYFWCGDNFIDNTKTHTIKKAKELVAEATKNIKNEIENASKQMHELFHKEVASTGCGFWANWKSKGEICKHVKHFLKVIEIETIDNLEIQYNNYMNMVNPSSTSSNDLQKLKRYSFKKHVLMDGPKGFGKTYGVYQFLDDEKIPTEDIFEVGGFEGLESIDLLGQNIPFVKEIKKSNKSVVLKANNIFASQEGTEHVQDLVWMDGALTAAFRNASKGKQTVLMIDELLRIPGRELSILIAALTPNNKGEFTLRTRRVIGLNEDGCGIEEIIKVKKENLWIVATTNIGAEYDVDEIESALADRFMIIHKGAERSVLKTVLDGEIKKRKLKVTTDAKLMEFYDKMVNFKKTENISKIINTRHLTEIIEFAIDEIDIPNVVKDQILKWVDRDIEGKPDETQLKLIEKTIESIWR